MAEHLITGFSRFSRLEKLEMASRNLNDPQDFIRELQSYWHPDPERQQAFDEISENTISNFYLPYGVAPNFRINGQIYMVPMVTEESSVVAAAASSARYWFDRGGFTARVLSVKKTGQVYFTWSGDINILSSQLSGIERFLRERAASITRNMEKRGGGIKGFELADMRDILPQLYRLNVSFDTVDSMGANFINTCLETFASGLKDYFNNGEKALTGSGDLVVIMAILSNHTPECLVECNIECRIPDLEIAGGELSPADFAGRFRQAVVIAASDPFRAVTHNKGIFNGIDAVVLATGNDSRAVEAGGHAYAAMSGRYTSLTHLDLREDTFRYTLRIPLAVGTVGGLTSSHPLARRSMALLGNPDASRLMEIIASVGLANNFAAIRSLVTTGIQKGHMKMHLSNILNSLDASDDEKQSAREYFSNRTVSNHEVAEYLAKLRNR